VRRGRPPRVPGVGLDVRDVVVHEHVVQPRWCDVVPERLERHRMVARRQAQLLQGDRLVRVGHAGRRADLVRGSGHGHHLGPRGTGPCPCTTPVWTISVASAPAPCAASRPVGRMTAWNSTSDGSALLPSPAARVAHFDGPGGTQVPRRSRRPSRTPHLRDRQRGTVTDAEVVRRTSHRRPLGRGGPGRWDPVRGGLRPVDDPDDDGPLRALARDWGPGDEVVVTRLDHDANIGRG